MLEKDDEEMYNEFLAESERNVFLRIGQSLITDKFIVTEPDIHIKTYDELYFEYISKLDKKIDSLFYKHEQIIQQINVMTLENIVTLSNIKDIEAQLCHTNIFSIITFQQYLSKESLQKQLDNHKAKYCKIFDIITKLHEEILEIDGQIKNTQDKRNNS